MDITHEKLQQMLQDDFARPVSEYDNYYITRDGKVITKNYRYSGSPAYLKPASQKSGYLYVVLCKDGIKYHHRVHRLVAESFLINSLGLSDVNHIDEDKKNNNINNLEWVSHKVNMNHGSIQDIRAEKRSKKVAQIDNNGGIIRIFKSTREAERNGFAQSSISACARGKMSDHKGFKWKYV